MERYRGVADAVLLMTVMIYDDDDVLDAFVFPLLSFCSFSFLLAFHISFIIASSITFSTLHSPSVRLQLMARVSCES